jgi:hypothetical protein
MRLTKELLERAKVKLSKAEMALQADPSSRWLQLSVKFEQEKVDAIRQSLQKA